MQQEDPNYARHQEEHRLNRIPVSMSAQDERRWSAIAHLSILLNLISAIGGPVAALVIWLVYKDRSRVVAFHALQSLWYQVAWIVILSVGWSITYILMFVLIGFVLVPVMAIASIVPFVHQCYAAYKISQGVDYRYPIIADRVDGERRVA
ncbi:MAG TPA: DUF4870 domain-containing protein [Gammaproteobacteria bacterium]|nr:DUF4870 domain-containing protein [Gammaproteobacteria bacterium]